MFKNGCEVEFPPPSSENTDDIIVQFAGYLLGWLQIRIVNDWKRITASAFLVRFGHLRSRTLSRTNLTCLVFVSLFLYVSKLSTYLSGWSAVGLGLLTGGRTG